MIVVKPLQVEIADLISSSAAISLYPQWSAALHYDTGDKVYHQPMGFAYPHDWESLVDNNHNVPPGSDPLKWLDLGVSNRYAMFDAVVGTQTQAPMSLDVTVRVGAIVTAVVLFGIDAGSIRVRLDDPAEGVVYDRTIELTDYTPIVNGYTYYFEALNERQTEIAILDLPSYPAADLIVNLDNGAGIAMCAEMVIGELRVLGVSNFGTQIGLRSYSRKDVDEFGNFVIVPRRFVKTADYDVTYETQNLATIQRRFSELLDIPAVYIGDPNRIETIIYGFFEDFQTVISEPSISNGTVRVQGLV